MSEKKADVTLDDFLTNHREEIEELSNGRILCKITKHELPKRLDLLQAHWQGKAFKRAQAQKEKEPVNLEDYEFLKPHKKSNQQVYCKLTKRAIPNDKLAIRKHIQGRRFKNAMAKKSKQKEEQLSVEEADNDENEEKENDLEILQEEFQDSNDNNNNNNNNNNNDTDNVNSNDNNDNNNKKQRKEEKKKIKKRKNNIYFKEE